jgi:beta-lactamase class A
MSKHSEPRSASTRIFGGRATSMVVAFLCGGIVFGVAVWFLCLSFYSAPTGAVLYQSSDYNDYQYIDPLLACDIGGDGSFSNLNPLQSTLESTVNQAIANGQAMNVSIYFRSLKDSHWFDINPNDQYAPASLFKTFIMMAYFKESRDLNDPGLLNKEIVYQGSPTTDNNDDPGAVTPRLVNGQLYTINQVITQMIVYSDNDALNTLVANFDNITDEDLTEIFSDLQITSPLTDDSSGLMSVDQYAMIFRVLYGSTYLSRKLSDEALSLLAQTQFTGGLVAGVPSGILVAHKFGVRTDPATATTTEVDQFHDCGIIYAPQNPYILCVMTKGSSYNNLIGLVKDLSAETYQEVQTIYPEQATSSNPS